MVKAVIFDFDGVIGDTMADNYVAWQKAFEPYGFHLAPDGYYPLEGMGRYQIAEYVIAKNGLDITDVKGLVEAKELYYKQNNTFRIYDGVTDIFGLLGRHGIAIAIVTGASRARITEHLGQSMASQLTALITADDVTHTKPDPEPYLKAVAQLGLPAADCLVVENAILGIQSAKAAGCQCYALETTMGRKGLAMADEIFATHTELLLKLENILGA